ncbi:hypothetical protein J6590_055696 [Homalodisca vitripennis]|nr:hypothetical protein J6590_055696 [Homalodisca vitripennis]
MDKECDLGSQSEMSNEKYTSTKVLLRTKCSGVGNAGRGTLVVLHGRGMCVLAHKAKCQKKYTSTEILLRTKCSGVGNAGRGTLVVLHRRGMCVLAHKAKCQKSIPPQRYCCVPNAQKYCCVPIAQVWGIQAEEPWLYYMDKECDVGSQGEMSNEKYSLPPQRYCCVPNAQVWGMQAVEPWLYYMDEECDIGSQGEMSNENVYLHRGTAAYQMLRCGECRPKNLGCITWTRNVCLGSRSGPRSTSSATRKLCDRERRAAGPMELAERWRGK